MERTDCTKAYLDSSDARFLMLTGDHPSPVHLPGLGEHGARRLHSEPAEFDSLAIQAVGNH